MSKTRTMADSVNNAGGGGSVGFVASGDIPAAGLAVTLNNDGTVSAVTTLNDAIGSAVGASGASTGLYVRACFLAAAGKVVVLFGDSANSYKVSYAIGTVTGTSISFSTHTTTTVGPIYDLAVCEIDGTSNIAFAYKNGSNAGVVQVASLSGTTLTFGAGAQFAPNASTPSICPVPGTTSVAIGYVDNYGSALVVAGSSSGTSISVGGATTVVGASDSTSRCIGVGPNYQTGKVVALAHGNSSNSYALVMGITGTTITAGTTTLVAALRGYYANVCDIKGTDMVLLTIKTGVSGSVVAYLGTISGTSISFGAQATVTATDSSYMSAVHDSMSGPVVLTFRSAAGQAQIVRGTISGTSISFSAPTTVGATAAHVCALYDSVNGETVVVYRHGTTGVSTANVVQSLRTTKSLRFGISESSALDTEAVNVTVLGGVNEAVTGLTPGATYYVGDTGNLTTTGGANPRIGRALSATSIVVTDSV